jgi:hypothetical protein
MTLRNQNNREKFLASIPLAMVLLTSGTAFGQITIDRQVTIQPIRISNGSSTVGPSSDSSLLAAFGVQADKIWSQAGIDIRFLPLETVTSSTFFDVTSGTGTNSLSSLSSASGLGQSSDIHVINLWFVNQINSSANILGVSLQSIATDGTFTLTRDGIAIGSSALTKNGGNPASDTIAHEIGHALGLDHVNFGASGQLNLMSSTTYPPSGLSDIFPSGGDYDQLTPAQISQARSVSFFALTIPSFTYTSVPEPASTGLVMGLCVLGSGLLIRRWKRSHRSL